MLLSNCMRSAALFRTPLITSKLSISPTTATSMMLKSTGSAQHQMDEFWKKNKKRNRPMSPHLTIYKPQLTSMLSITTRITGLGLAGATSLFALATATYTGDLSSILNYAESLHETWGGAAMLFTAKYLIAWPFAFHTCNGLRHLGWDMGKGLGLKEVYTGGWAVVIASIILADLLVLMY